MAQHHLVSTPHIAYLMWSALCPAPAQTGAGFQLLSIPALVDHHMSLCWLQPRELTPALLQEQITNAVGISSFLFLAVMLGTAVMPIGNGKQGLLPLR